MLNDNHWNQYAKTFGFSDMRKMLQKIYIDDKMSLETCAEELDISIYTTKRLIQRFIIDSVVPKKKLAISEVELKRNTLGQIASKYGVSRSTIWRLRKAIKKRIAPGEGS
jgi:predicted DNA-binding protein (UPF0251 family)